MDLNALIEGQIVESKCLEYKEALPLKQNAKCTKEERADSIFGFLKLICSLANSEGGVVLYGMSERGSDIRGCAASIRPIVDESYDEAKRRLSSLIENHITPRLTFDTASIPVASDGEDGYVFAIRVPKSLSWPHMASYRNRSGYYVRSDAKSSEMDAHDVRTAVLASEEVMDRVRRTTSLRLDSLATGEHPIGMSSHSLLVIQAVSLEAFSRGMLNTKLPSGSQLLDKCSSAFYPVLPSSGGFKYNLDGVLAYRASAVAHRRVLQYIQVCRNGLVEMVWSDVLSDGPYGGPMELPDPESPQIIAAEKVEPYLINIVEQLHLLLSDIGFVGPATVSISLLNCNGCSLLHLREYPRRCVAQSSPAPLTESRIQFPDFELDTFQKYDFPQVLKPVFDMLWNAAGSERSPSYDADGNWIGAPSAGS